jgi:hypothetical protein
MGRRADLSVCLEDGAVANHQPLCQTVFPGSSRRTMQIACLPARSRRLLEKDWIGRGVATSRPQDLGQPQRPLPGRAPSLRERRKRALAARPSDRARMNASPQVGRGGGN